MPVVVEPGLGIPVLAGQAQVEFHAGKLLLDVRDARGGQVRAPQHPSLRVAHRHRRAPMIRVQGHQLIGAAAGSGSAPRAKGCDGQVSPTVVETEVLSDRRPVRFHFRHQATVVPEKVGRGCRLATPAVHDLAHPLAAVVVGV
jgi:hypothetical protein